MKKMIFICLSDNDGNDRYQKLMWNLRMEYPGAPFLRRAADIECLFRLPEKNDTALIFLIHMDSTGINLMLDRVLKKIALNPGCLEGTAASLIVIGDSELYTKGSARRAAFILNRAGCLIPGKAFAEATGSLRNLCNRASCMGKSTEEMFLHCAKKAVLAAVDFGKLHREKEIRNLVCIHSSIPGKSNTYDYWKLIKEELVSRQSEIITQEINLQGGKIRDCRGCSYETCRDFGEKRQCFFGGIMTEDVYPAIEKCDAVLMLCPNYNDSLGADLTACINRLTALYRNVDFSGKYLFAAVVSGYSGGDLVAEQLIDAMVLNKGFTLPGYAVDLRTANHPGELLKEEGIRKSAGRFAGRIVGKINVSGVLNQEDTLESLPGCGLVPSKIK